MSFIFSFPLLFIFVILLAVFLFWAYYKLYDNYHTILTRFLPVLLLVLGISSLLVINNYLNPPTRIFKNTDHTVLAHKGFRANDQLIFSDDKSPNNALWDRSAGRLGLARQNDHVILSAQGYYEPVFFAGLNSSGSLKLLNPVFTENIESGIIFLYQNEPAIKLSFKRDELNPHETNYIIYSYLTGETDTSTFNRTIYRGYPVLSVLLQSRLADQIVPELRYALEGSLFVRDHIAIRERVVGKKENFYFLFENRALEGSRLLFFPSAAFISSPYVNVNLDYDESYFSRAYETPLVENDYFFKGIGYSQSEVYLLSKIEVEAFEVQFMLPRMFRLPGEKTSQTFFITTSEEHIINNDLTSGYLLGEINNPANNYHIYNEVDFIPGRSSRLLSFRVKDHAISATESITYNANENIYINSLNNAHSIYWIASFVDFKNTNPINGRLFYFYIFFSILLLVGLIYMRSFLRVNGQHSILHPLEITIYLIIYLMVLLRLFLIWRVSTFPPIENISAGEFYTLQNSFKYAINYTLYPVIAFITFFSLFALWRERLLHAFQVYFTRRLERVYFSQNQTLLISFSLVAFYLVILGLLLNISSSVGMFRILVIFLPVFLFFFFDFIVRELFQHSVSNVAGGFHILRIVALGLVWGLTVGFLLIKDTGYGIIFASFLSFYLVLNYFFHRRQLVVAFLAFWLIVFWVHDVVILWVMLNFHIVVYLVITTSLVLVIWFLLRRNVILWIELSIGQRLAFAIVILTLFLGSIAITDYLEIKQKIGDNMSYGKYRVESLRSLTSDLLQKYSFDSRENSFILRASQNQYFINYYSNLPRGKYFNLQQHFHQGSTFITQTTDLVILRYVVAEHFRFLVLLILLLFLAPIFALSYFDSDGELRDRIYVNGPMGLIVVTSLLVLFAATNRFAFFGQDFPFLSTTSLLSLLLPLALYSIVMIQIRYNYGRGNTDFMNNYYAYLLIGFVIGSYLLAPASLYKDKGQNNKYELNELMVDVEKKINLINNDFLIFQSDNKEYLMHKPFRYALNSYIHHASESVALLLTDTTESNQFFLSIWKHLTDPAINHWNPGNIIHVRKRNEFFHLAVNKSFYSILPPQASEASWKGNLVAADLPGRIRFFNHINREVDLTLDDGNHNYKNILTIIDSRDVSRYRKNLLNLDLVKVSGKHTPTSNPILLLNSKRGSYDATNASFKVKANNEQFDESTTGGYVVGLRNNDHLILSVKVNDNQRDIVHWQLLRENSFLSQSMQINGRQRAFYPLGEKFVWAYSFTQLVNDTYKDKSGKNNNDVHVTIDYHLTNRFYELSKLEMSSLSRIGTEEKEIFRRFLLGDRSALLITQNGILIHPSGRSGLSNRFLSIVDSINQQFNSLSLDFDTVERDMYLRALIKDLAFSDDHLFSAVVIDGNGKIRSLFDYKDQYRVNPNNINDFNAYVENLYRHSTNALERDLFANECLVGLLPGPASSFKPILYSSVMSQMNLNWSNLRVLPISINWIPQLIEPLPAGQILKYYGGKNISSARWNIEMNMFLNNGLTITPGRYLTNSNNLYHSVIVFLGSYSWNQLSGFTSSTNNTSFPLTEKSPNNLRYNDFPVIRSGSRNYVINPISWPDFRNEHSLISIGLTNNFHLYTNTNRFSSWYRPTNAFGEHFNSLHGNIANNYNLWVFPEESRFLAVDRSVEPSFRTGFVQPILGGFPIYVTPLKMAEAAFRVISLNNSKDLLTLDDQALNNYNKHSFFDYDTRTYESMQSFFRQYQENVLHPLRNVAKTGTARSLNSFVRKHEESGYYFYMKTGTISHVGEKEKRNKNLMVIITNKEVESDDFTYKDLKELKFYVLFLTYHGIDNSVFNNRMFEKYIEAVIESPLFKLYMEGGI